MFRASKSWIALPKPNRLVKRTPSILAVHDYPWWEITLVDGLLALMAERPHPTAS